MEKLSKRERGKKVCIAIAARLHETVKKLAEEYGYTVKDMAEYLIQVGIEDVLTYQAKLEELANTPVKIVSSNDNKEEE